MLEQIRQAEIKYKRDPKSVSLLAVSKGQPIEKILAAVGSGQKEFGENYLQEAIEKIEKLKYQQLAWHFIGAIQSNKTELIARNFSWVHSVSRIKIIKLLNKYRKSDKPKLNICLQLNISNEKTKSGANLEELPELMQEVINSDCLMLRGLMVIPERGMTFKEQLDVFKQVVIIKSEMADQGYKLDTLSMGMSHDFSAAISAGSTMVRIGTAIFGKRKKEKERC